MDIQALGMLSNITAIEQKQNVNTIEGDINVEKDFYGTLREQQINCVKEDIYNKFHIDVGAANGYFECYIPSDVLYKMNTDTALRQKVYDMLADYSSDKFKLTMQTLNPPVKKCTLVFDGNGEGEYNFAKFFIEDYDRFGDLVENKYMELNSHSSSSISRYEKELENYNKIIDDNKEKNRMNYLDLTEEEIKSILRI